MEQAEALEAAARAAAPAVEVAVREAATPAAPPEAASLLEAEAVVVEEARLAAEDQLQLEVQLVCL